MPKRVTDNIKQYRLIEEFHELPHNGHFGIRKTLAKLKQRYIWKNMNKMVKNYVRTCSSCQKKKQIKHTKEPLTITDTPSKSFDTIVIDTVGPLRPSKNFRYILTAQCELTKYVVACPIESKDAKSVAKTLVEHIILKYGLFNILKTDKGTEFNNELMKEICALLKIEHKFSTPYHHETVGTVERNHRVLNEYLLNFVEDENWHEWIQYFTFAFNTTPNVDTEYSPFELIFGKLPRLPNDELTKPQKTHNLDNYANELKTRLRYSIQRARELILAVKEKRKLESTKKQNSIDIKIGDLVLVKVENIKKHQNPYKGPYKVIDINDLNVVIEIEKSKLKTLHKNILKKYIK